MIAAKDFVFVHLQKTGGSFIEQFLLKNYKCKELTPKHRGVSTVLPEYQDHLKIGAVRNPFDWYVSWWSANTQAESTLFPLIFTDKARVDFNEFIRVCCEEDWGVQHDLRSESIHPFDIGVYTYRYIRAFCIPNIPFVLKYHERSFLMDRILLQENLAEGLADALELTGRKRKKLLSMDKVHTSRHSEWNKYYSKESMELIRHKDRLIFEEWYEEEL